MTPAELSIEVGDLHHDLTGLLAVAPLAPHPERGRSWTPAGLVRRLVRAESSPSAELVRRISNTTESLGRRSAELGGLIDDESLVALGALLVGAADDVWAGRIEPYELRPTVGEIGSILARLRADRLLGRQPRW